MGPSVKFVSPNKGLISKKNWGSIFFVGKMTKPGGGRGGSEGGLAKDHIFSHFFFELFPNKVTSGKFQCTILYLLCKSSTKLPDLVKLYVFPNRYVFGIREPKQQISLSIYPFYDVFVISMVDTVSSWNVVARMR